MISPVSLRDIVRAARARLEVAGIDANEAAMDAALLARHLLGWNMARLLAHETEPPPVGFSPARLEDWSWGTTTFTVTSAGRQFPTTNR